MTYRRRETMKEFARYMANKYRLIERLRKEREQNLPGESSPAMTEGASNVRDRRA